MLLNGIWRARCGALRLVMIRSFRLEGLRDFCGRYHPWHPCPGAARKIRRMLTAVDTANTIGYIGAFPGWRLHPLRGEYLGQWSLTVTGNLRLVFEFEGGDASNLDLVDSH